MADNVENRRIDVEIHREGRGGTDPFAAAVRATRMPMLITDPTLPDNPIVFVNDAFARLTGYTRQETLNRNCRFLQGPGTNQDDVKRMREAINRRVPIELDLLNYRKDGTTFWNRLLMSPVFNDGELSFFFASQFDITPERERLGRVAQDRDALEAEVSRRVSDLTASEDRLKFTLSAGRLGAWTLDLIEQRLVASGLCKINFGRQPSDTFTYRDLQASILLEDMEHWRQAVGAAVAGNGDLDVAYRITTPSGELRWIEVRAQTRFDADGKPISMAGVSQDITDRKLAESHRDLLTKEMSHRVKNTLATVQSIVGQSLRGADVPPEVAAVIAQRLQALAGAHDVLTNTGWEEARLADIVKTATAPFDSGPTERIHIGGDEVTVSSAASTAIALAVHELATNAVKYGALSNDTGVVTVNWHIENGLLDFKWTESGGPVVGQPTRTGFGSRMIERALAASIQGKAEIDYRSNGVVFRITTAVSNLSDTSSGGPEL
ncbi:MAG: PAS domain-containing protein [Candidatus Devosia phytovorans]|uniref:Blue-light-activated histidine kinase n=1 Tax=Candidatus Devosia phytovorans TaxID=3121372 RepID=A0AAJ6B0I3_9HYPH|nr:PAS domain-containing protein [Devosia sp.]WEK04731.1 MAG: PAS domain-containing protein [Devosia sp.]